MGQGARPRRVHSSKASAFFSASVSSNFPRQGMVDDAFRPACSAGWPPPIPGRAGNSRPLQRCNVLVVPEPHVAIGDPPPGSTASPRRTPARSRPARTARDARSASHWRTRAWPNTGTWATRRPVPEGQTRGPSGVKNSLLISSTHPSIGRTTWRPPAKASGVPRREGQVLSPATAGRTARLPPDALGHQLAIHPRECHALS